MTTAAVEMWGRRIGAVAWDESSELGYFEFDPEFARSGIEVAPMQMPLPAAGKRGATQVFSFPGLGREGFRGLPGLLADSLPDRFGTALIDAWLASRGRSREGFDPVERLCYTGSRGMGALEFVPALDAATPSSNPLDVAELAQLARLALTDRAAFVATLRDSEAASDAVQQILRVGTSAGGARAKALIAWNPDTGAVRSGQLRDIGAGFSHWLLKFDGVGGDRGQDLLDAEGFGRIEYAYYLMARAAGIEMTECRLLQEGGRAHFMTRRFDREPGGRKLHLQSLCALQHLDFNLAGAHSYEQAVATIRALDLSVEAVEEQYRRAVFNLVGRNQDDHTKNIAFLMDKAGQWALSPAYDLGYAWNPNGAWTNRHQMTLQGKRDGFERVDFEEFGRFASMKRGRARAILAEVVGAVRRWREFAERAGVPPTSAEAIGDAHRIGLSW